jgi:UDP-N-acetylglucosamine acyltransferase
MCKGQPAQARSMNFEGLRRRGFSAERMAAVKAMHKALYRSDLTLEQAIQSIEALGNGQCQADVDLMVSFLRHASPQRGIVR